MIVKAILAVSLLKICTGDVQDPQPKSNQATYSQSFVRHDVPMSYKYSAVHIYTTAKPDQSIKTPVFPQHHHAKPQSPHVIQYAPVYNQHNEQQKSRDNIPHYYESTPTPDNVNVVPFENKPLEPKLQENHNVRHQQNHQSYIPGYNVELLQAVNKYPLPSAVPTNYPSTSNDNKINKVNYLKQYVLHPLPAEEYLPHAQNLGGSVAEQLEASKVTLSPFVPKQQVHNNGHRSNLYTNAYAEPAKPAYAPHTFINLQELIPHPKAHRMLVNIAREYNIARNPRKAQRASLTLLRNMIPTHTQAIINKPSPANFEKNTRLLQLEQPLY